MSTNISSTLQTKTAKIGSLVDVQESEDPEGLRVFYYLVQDLKALVFSLIALHFKVIPTTAGYINAYISKSVGNYSGCYSQDEMEQ